MILVLLTNFVTKIGGLWLLSSISTRLSPTIISIPKSSDSVSSSSSWSKTWGRLTCKDLRLHKLVFRDDALPDGTELAYFVRGQNSVNAQEPKIPYPWLVFNDKVKVNSVFLRDSIAVSDSVLLLFGGKISKGGLDGHLKMLGGYLEFFMKPSLANTYLRLKNELEELIQMKLVH
ncbi:DExH-box ATP-dependent RNA helicase DExH3-like isoform X2 [Camellia sinensis]|uniref:DExH-box ATP-dependent RNA helicase DExH3-like isoform X2 n=1 Tax=Camellia sinensis TaxID=4442 RepID=UPI00103639D9|nr:DExH-box ATP-dependent RNA helicase DExH3-like isoform X2 [Camellia sinensis]